MTAHEVGVKQLSKLQQRKEALKDYAKIALVDDEWLHVDYDAEPNEDGTEISIRRTAWFKAHRAKDRDILHQEEILRIERYKVPDLIKDLAVCLEV